MGISAFISVGVYSLYNLNRARHAEILAEIEARKIEVRKIEARKAEGPSGSSSEVFAS